MRRFLSASSLEERELGGKGHDGSLFVARKLSRVLRAVNGELRVYRDAEH